ncbi:hypothetical protein M758_8G156100, partial [Ceratodon purpureus]
MRSNKNSNKTLPSPASPRGGERGGVQGNQQHHEFTQATLTESKAPTKRRMTADFKDLIDNSEVGVLMTKSWEELHKLHGQQVHDLYTPTPQSDEMISIGIDMSNGCV